MDFKIEIAKSISKAADLSVDEIVGLIEIPPDKKMGDYAFPCFKLAKTLRKAPPLIAQEISGKIEKPDFVSSVAVQGAYLNFFSDKSYFVKEVLLKAEDKDYVRAIKETAKQ